ncbi:MAG TPA: alpha/beta fold hydrolase [Jatrophihabitans sp.]
MPDTDLLPLLHRRLIGLYSPLLADTTATILFTAGGPETWTVDIDRGRSSARVGRPLAPTTTVRAALPVLTDVVSGRRSGVEAFLAGDLTVRGNLALALQLDGLFADDPDDVRRTMTRAVHADGLETFYLESGPHDAPPVVLVHGLSATNASMLPLIPPLARRYRVLAPDLPGHGGTEARTSAHAPAYLGRWLGAFLRKTCDRPAVLIGNSLGGRTALQAALDAPEAVSGLVLLCPAVAFRKLRQFVPLVRLVPDRVAALPVHLPRRLATRGLRNLFAEPSRLPAAWYDSAIDEFARVLGVRANRLATFSALRHVYLDEPFGGSGFWDRLPDLAPPALFLWGDRDVLVPAAFGRWVHQALPDARSIVLEDCGHVPQFEHPELTLRYTIEFIESLTS